MRTTPRVKLVQGLLEASFPGCARDLARVRVANGRSLLQQLAVVDAKYFTPARAGKPWPPQQPWEPLPLERAVAEFVGPRRRCWCRPSSPTSGITSRSKRPRRGGCGRRGGEAKHEGAPDLQGGPEKGWQPVVLAAKVHITELPG